MSDKEEKIMKGKGKRLAALLTLLVLTFSSVIVASADSNTTLIKRSTSVSNQTLEHHVVSVAADTTDTARFTLTVKRANDSFKLYNLVNISASENSDNGITSIDIQWATPVADFIATHSEFANDAEYATPAKLGAYTVDQSLSDEARAQAEAAAKVEKEKKLIALVNAMKSEYSQTEDKSVTAIGKLEPVAYVDGNSVASGTTPNYEVLGNGQNLSTSGTAQVIGTGVTENSWNFSYDITNLKFGLYFVDASNPARASGQGYQPVVVDLVPEQTGPSGHWYLDDTKTATLKNESISVTKKINGHDNDIIREGEIVNFTVEFDIPLYNKTNNRFDYTQLNAFDDMSQAFILIATSAKLTFFDANGNEFHPVATLNGDGYGNKVASDMTGTYSAQLIGYSYPVTYSGDVEEKPYFYITEEDSTAIKIWTNHGGKLESVRLNKTKTDGKYVFTVNDLNAINNQLDADNQIPVAYITSTNAPKFTVSETSKSLISIEVDYEKLMNPETYTTFRNQFWPTASDAMKASYPMSENFTVPSKIVVTYDTLVSDEAYLGTDNNTNKVTVYYVEDTTGKIGEVSDEVVAWTYGANIVKVDGEAYEVYQNLSAEEKAAAKQKNETPFLEGAVFDIYRLDTEYCGGATNNTQSQVPAEVNYNTFSFYSDVDYPISDPTNSDPTARYTEARGYYQAMLMKAMQYELTQKMAITDSAAIRTGIGQALANFGSYATADNFTNKYDFTDFYSAGTFAQLHNDYHGNILLDYITPMAQTDKVNGKDFDEHGDFADGYVIYVPRWVEAGECHVHSGGHWHLDAYSLFWADTTSIATEDGVTLKGFDPNHYLMVEKTAPAGGYNKLNTAIYFEVNQISNEQFVERGNSYAGFISDEYEDAEGNKVTDNNIDGIYHFTVKNYTGLTLPSTGGIGTLLFTLIGIVVMGGAIVFVIARNRKLRKSAAAFMSLVFLLAATFGPSVLTAHAATTISLGNGDGLNIGAQKAVPGGTAVFTVHLRDKDDTLQVYQIATSTYDDEKGEFTDLTWVSNLFDYLGNYSLDTGNDNIPTDPSQFTQLPAKEQADFLSWVYDVKDKTGIGSTYKVNDNRISTLKNNSSNEYYATISNVPYGMYLIKGSNKTLNRSYSILTLSAVPEIQGPMGMYYLTGDLEATLKYADVTVQKYINMGKSDVVRTGETVSFEVVGEIPEYYPIIGGNVLTKEDGDAYTNYDWNANYKFNLTDEMSQAFKLNQDTLKIYTGNEIATDGWTEASPEIYTALIAPAYSTTTQSGVMWYKDSTDKDGNYLIKNIEKNDNAWNVTWYLYNDKEGYVARIANSTASTVQVATSAPDSSIISAYQTVAGVASVGTVAKVENKDIFAVAFDYSRLVDINPETGVWTRNTKYVAFQYQATVTENCLPGTEENTNTAKLWYRSDIAGHYSPVEDVVRAYTYAVRLVKTDGEVANKYLLGAKFKLYKEAYKYVPDATIEGATEALLSAEPSESTWQYYKFGSYAANGEYTSESTEPPVDDNAVALTTLNLVEDATYEGGLNTYFRYVPVEAGEDGLAYPHYNVIVYKQMSLVDQTDKDSAGNDYKTVENNIINSVDTEAGVLIDGLEEASYVLIETQQPTGYNALTEAMRFEINRISAEQHELTDNAAYTSDVIFYSANRVDKNDPNIVDAVAVEETNEQGETVINYYQGYSDGIYGINVKNYQGLTLPSTGGIGTLIFTIIGIILMAAVILLIIIKRKKQSYM